MPGVYKFLATRKVGEIIRHKRYVGFEIECEGRSYDDYQRFIPRVDTTSCIVKGDGSLRNGLELVTFPRRLLRLEEVVKQHTEMLKANGLQISDRCGLHMHMDGRDIVQDSVKIARIFKTFFVLEDALYAVITPSRKQINWCRPLSKRYRFDDIPEDTDRSEVGAKWFRVNKEEYDRGRRPSIKYQGLNLDSLYYRGSIEFRYHHGSLDAHEMLMWADLLLSMVDYATTEKYNFEFLQSIKDVSIYEKFEHLMTILEFDEEKRAYWKDQIAIYNSHVIHEYEESKKKAVPVEAVVQEKEAVSIEIASEAQADIVDVLGNAAVDHVDNATLPSDTLVTVEVKDDDEEDPSIEDEWY